MLCSYLVISRQDQQQTAYQQEGGFFNERNDMENLEQSDIVQGILLGEQAAMVLRAAGFAVSGCMEQNFVEAYKLDLLTFPDATTERNAFACMSAIAGQYAVEADMELVYA